MSRTFVPIRPTELSARIMTAAEKVAREEFERNLRGAVWTLIEEDDRLHNDLKVNVNFENFECMNDQGYNGCKSITGLQRTKHGLSFVGCCAGGDWECPVFFIVYWDGKSLRLYVPTDGNTWNTDTKQAYGNDGLSDFNNVQKRWPHLAEDLEDHMKKERERWRQLRLPDDYFEFDPSDVPECDPEKILADIEARIQLKGEVSTSIPGKGSVSLPSPADGIKVTRAQNWIVVQPTNQGDVAGHGLMLTRDMAALLAKEIIDLL